MELKGVWIDHVSSKKVCDESKKWNWKLQVLISITESALTGIQKMELKVEADGTYACRVQHTLNPKNGIERPCTSCSSSTPSRGIQKMELKAATRLTPLTNSGLRIQKRNWKRRTSMALLNSASVRIQKRNWKRVAEQYNQLDEHEESKKGIESSNG